MIGLIFAIIGMIVAGVFIAYVIKMTSKWIINKINEMAAKKNAKKVAVGDLIKLIEEARENNDNRINRNDLNQINNQGYSHFVVTVDSDNQIIDEVELIKDQNDTLDAEVEKMLGNSGFLVVEV